ncbi:MobV family relaxase [Merismopedia glauca]|uniref:Mobilization protein n=1 Tax=Merismopedia glauca CCAP 1448/3 TaxID=1296344 RepID=A0A2T1C4A0_9CYAN|nr:MobV family relaxase [Merismopedia glauca]PSB03112.1 mobilization protein [Merismopedia glauca CCAP 1448/3]
MAYGICRIQKLKAGSLNGSGRHTNRESPTPNADPQRQHIRIIGAPDTKDIPNLETLVRQHIGEQTIRKNAVLAVEFLLTASPEYFRPDDPARSGYYDPQRLESFQQQACQWLVDRYGSRIVRAELHLDESTPHIHAYLVPLDDKGKLNCRGLLGGSRHRLSELQDDFASSMAPLGLQRGIKGSKAKHTEISKYYAAINSAPQANLDLATMQQLVADRERAIQKSARMERTAQALAEKIARSEALIESLENQKDAAAQTAKQWQTKYLDLANRVRDLPLEKVANELGLEPDPKSPHKWQHSNHTINITGSKFYDWQHLKGGGGAIDLVMHVKECKFPQAVAWLNHRFGESATLEAVTYRAREIIQTEPVPQFTPPPAQENHWQQLKTYLTRQCRLPSSLIDNLHHQGLLYADNRANAVWLRRTIDSSTINGATLQNTAGGDSTSMELAIGSERHAGWFHFQMGGQSGEPINRAILVKSPLDAISFAVLDRTESRPTIYLSTDGTAVVPVEFLQTLPQASVIVAYPNDTEGNIMAQKVMEQLPDCRRKTPKAQDWNSDLQKMLNLELPRSQRQVEPKSNQGLSL